MPPRYFLDFFFFGFAFAAALGDFSFFSAAFFSVFFSAVLEPNALSQFDQYSGVVPVRTIGPLMILPVQTMYAKSETLMAGR